MRDKNSFITSPKHKEVFVKNNELITIIILSEDHGHRMKSHGPTCLIKLGKKTLLENQVDAIKSVFTNFEIILCSGFETFKVVNFVKDNFENLNIRVVENQMHYNSNCCESIRLGMSNTMNNKIVILDGALMVKKNNFKNLNMTTSCIQIQSKPYDSNFAIGAIYNNSRLENLSLGIKNSYWSEIMYLNGKKDVNAFYNIVSNPDYKNKFMFEAINEMNRRSQFLVLKNSEPGIKIDNIKTLKRMIK